MPGEVLDESGRLGVGQHAVDLGGENFVLVQLPLIGEFEQLLIRHAAPEEVGEPHRQFVVADRARSRSGGCGVFGPEQELRRDEDGLQGDLHGPFKRLFAVLGDLGEADKAFELAVVDWAAKRSSQERFEVLASRVFVVAVWGGAMSDEGFLQWRQIMGRELWSGDFQSLDN